MQLEIALPTNLEGDWVIKDANGKVIASSKDNPGVVITLEPYFYKGYRSQIVARTTTHSAKGKRLRQLLRLQGEDGVCKTELCDKKKKLVRITPKFDTLTPTQKETEQQGKP